MIDGWTVGSDDWSRTHPVPSGNSRAQAIRACPDGTISPVMTFQMARVCSMTSLGYEGASEVTRSPNRRASALAVSLTSSFTWNVTEPMGWLNRFWPTPGDSARTGIPCSSSCSLGPMPDSMRMCGDLRAPALSTTRSQATVNISPPLSASTPVTLPPSMTTLRTNTPPRTVRFSLCRAGVRWVTLVLIRHVFTLFIGMAPMPPESGPFRSWFGE